MSDISPFHPRLIWELIVNRPTEFNDLSAAEFQKVCVHGVCFTISPLLINQFLGLSVSDDLVINYSSSEQLLVELTGGTVCFWPIDI